MRKRRSNKKARKLRKRKIASLNMETLTTVELLTRAQEQIDCLQFDTAELYCREALKREPDNLLALETISSVCIEKTNFHDARRYLGHAITLMPEEGHAKYMSLGQLSTGKESLQCYLKGIEILLRTKDNLQPLAMESEEESARTDSCSKADPEMASENSCDASSNSPLGGANGVENEPPQSSSSAHCEDSARTITRQLSSAYCSVADLYMTDMCDEEDAEEKCHVNITSSIQADPTNPEAYNTMASFLLVKQEKEEAKKYIQKAVELWESAIKAAKEKDREADPCPVPYLIVLNLARNLIETEEHEKSMEVLERLTEEDDEVVDTWYLMGWTCYLQGEEHREEAKYYIHRALQVHSKTPSSDDELVEHLLELLNEVGPYEETKTETLDDTRIEQELQEESDNEDNEDTSMDTT